MFGSGVLADLGDDRSPNLREHQGSFRPGGMEKRPQGVSPSPQVDKNEPMSQTAASNEGAVAPECLALVVLSSQIKNTWPVS